MLIQKPAYYFAAFLLFCLLPLSVNAGQCLPDLGSGKICTAKDFILSGVSLDGPKSCTAGETITQAFTVRTSIEPTANQRYDIGFFIGDNGEPPIQGSSCTFSSLTPNTGKFDAFSGNGPYRDLDKNQCGDVQQSDGIVFKDIVLTNVLCQDNDNDGILDISYALTWQNQKQQCDDPFEPKNFFPPSSSKCLTAVGNVPPVVVLPPPAGTKPLITISKNASPNILRAPGGDVTYTLNISNNGTGAVTLTALDDDIFGDLNGMGDCALPQHLEANEVYNCSFVSSITGAAGDTHINTVTALAKGEDGTSTPPVNDSAIVTFITATQPTASIGDLIWNDLNADGLHSSDEPGIAGINVILFQDTGNGFSMVQTTQTTDGGFYSFNELVPDSYRVFPDTSVAPLKRWVHTGGNIPHDVQLSADEHYQAADFGFTKASISVIKSVDQNAVPAPSALVNYTVTVSNNSAVDISPTQLGDSRFGDLSAKGCTLPATIPPGDHFDCLFAETINGNPGDEHHNTVVALARDQNQNLLYAADSAKVVFTDSNKGAIGFLVWNDVNANASYDIGEPLFNNVSLQLSGSATASTTTLNSGLYNFHNLSAGSYDVTVSDTNNVLSRYVLTTANPVHNSTLSSGQIDATANFGYAKAEIAISKTADKTTIYAPGDTITYTLNISNPGSIDLTVNNLDDNKFGSLNTDCSLPKPLLAGDSFTCNFSRNITGNPGDTHNNVVTVSANDSANHTFIAADSESVLIISAIGGSGTIGDLVWFDLNNNGIKDNGESGANGVTLDLIQAGIVIDSTTTTLGGKYGFNVINGDYQVKVTDTANILSGATLVSGSDPHTGISINDSIYIAADFGYIPPGSILTRPAISVDKTGNSDTIQISALETFNISVTNIGSVEVTLTTLFDSVYGALDGQGDCKTGGVIGIGKSYHCSFAKTLTGAVGDQHNNIVFAIAKDATQQTAVGADFWHIDFVGGQIIGPAQPKNIPTLSEWGIIILTLLLAFVAIWRAQIMQKNTGIELND